MIPGIDCWVCKVCGFSNTSDFFVYGDFYSSVRRCEGCSCEVNLVFD